MTRRKVLQWLGIAGAFKIPSTDKDRVLSILDRAHIDVADPSDDGTINAISVKVNGSEVTGTEDGMVIFRFSARGALTGIVVWNERMANRTQ